MSMSHFTIRRPIFTSMATLIVILLGAISLFMLPIDLMPDITFPSISVLTTYENASPEVVEELITRPIEEAMAAVPGAEEVTSSSSEGNSNVTVKFSWGTDLDAASADVRDRLDRVIGRLPDDAERPTLFKFDLSSMPIVFMGASADMDPIELRRIIDEQIKFRLESIPGVASLNIFGGREREIAVDVDPYRLKSFGIRLEKINEVMKRGNINKPAGYVERGNFEITIRAPGEFSSVREIRDTVIETRDGVPIRVGDVAEVRDTMQRQRRIARIDGRDGLRMAITKQSGANTVEVAAKVVAEVEKLNRDYSNINLKIIMNSADYINNSIDNVSSSAYIGGGLAIILVLLFIRNFLSTLVIGISIPVSVIATFALLYYGNLTLNLMTLGGLALGVGMLVDNSIVVLENIYRLRDEEGYSPAKAAEEGSSEMFSAIVASTLTTVVVFLPLGFIQGMAGLMFRQFALVVSFSLLCSLAAAVLLVPMLACRAMRLQDRHKPNPKSLARRMFTASEKTFLAMENEYKLAIAWCLNRRWSTLLFTLFVLAGSIFLVTKIDVEMLPKTDEGQLTINAEMDQGIRLDLMSREAEKLERVVIANVPELEAIIASVGGSWFRGVTTNQASITVKLGTREKRLAAGQRSTEAVAADLRKRFSNIPGLTIRVNESSSFLGRGMSSGSEPVEVEVRGHDLAIGGELARQVKAAISEIPGVVDARITREGGVPERLIRIDRPKAADLGLWVNDIADFLETCMAGKHAADFRDGGKEYPITVRLKNSEKMTIEELLSLSMVNASGRQVALGNVVHTDEDEGPTIIERKNQQRIISVKAALSGRALGSAMEEVQKAVKGIAVPSGFSLEFGTDYQDQQEMMESLIFGFVLSLVLVYMVMACQFESLVDPFIIMFSVPLAAIGVFVALFLTNTTINMQSMIGCIMLGGIVVNNAIILVDHANLLRERDGMSVREALEEAGRRRLRPILMTALTTILGLVPMSLGWGDGGEAQAPMARAVVGGLLSSTFITLLVVPVAYSLVEEGRKRRKNGISDENGNGAGTNGTKEAETGVEPAR